MAANGRSAAIRVAAHNARTTRMHRLKVKLAFPLADETFGEGPRFHRWLPEGEVDAIALRVRDIPDPNTSATSLKVWFDCRGTWDTARIRVDPRGDPIPPEVAERQGHITAGPLLALLELEIPDASARSLVDDAVGTHPYEELGRAAYTAVHRPIAEFVDLLRYAYGQFWLRPVEAIRDREKKTASYFARRNAHWSIDGGATWKRFLPGTVTSEIEVMVVSGPRRSVHRSET